MASNRYNKFTWSFTGYDNQQEAEKALSDMENWFKSTFDANEFQMVSTIKMTSHGWQTVLECVKDPANG